MKRALLIAGGTVGGLGAVLSITPPQLGSSNLSTIAGASADTSIPATTTKTAAATTAAATPAAKAVATKKATTTTKKSTPKAVALPRMSSEDKRWEARDALRTLQRAQEMQGNKALMGMVKKEAKEQMAAINKVTGS